jgi:LysR family hydrogen peroxide-inducible transcriptional activator
MELNHLRYFYEVAKAGSFTEASRVLRVSQPALSKTVAQLEDREGVKLLERSKKGVSLTTMGEMVYSRCDEIFRALKDLDSVVSGQKSICAGPLRIGASDHVSNYLLPKVLVSFHRKYPEVIPSLYTGTPTEMVSRIQERDLEFGLFFTRIESPVLEYLEVGSVEFVAVFHPKFLAKLPGNAAQKRSYLGELGFVGSRSRDYRKHHPAADFLDTLGADRKILLETNNQETQKRLSLAGYGYAVLPRFMVEGEIRRKELCEIPSSKRMVVPMLMAKRKNHVFSLPAQKFMENLDFR